MSTPEKQNTILDLNKLVKMAREHFYIGLYPESINFYLRSFDIINKRINELSTPLLKNNWKMILQNLKKEKEMISDMQNLCKNLTKAKFDFSNDETQNISKRRLIPKPIDENFLFQNPDKKRINQSVKNNYSYGNKKRPQKQYTNFHPNQINEWKTDDSNIIEWRKNQKDNNNYNNNNKYKNYKFK